MPLLFLWKWVFSEETKTCPNFPAGQCTWCWPVSFMTPNSNWNTSIHFFFFSLSWRKHSHGWKGHFGKSGFCIFTIHKIILKQNKTLFFLLTAFFSLIQQAFPEILLSLRQGNRFCDSSDIQDSVSAFKEHTVLVPRPRWQWFLSDATSAPLYWADPI